MCALGIAEIDGERVRPVLLADRSETRVDGFERLVPRRLVKGLAAPHQGSADPVGIRFELLERSPLRAQETVTEHVVAIAAHERDGPPLEPQLEPARRLAQMTRAVLGSRCCSRRHEQRIRPKCGVHDLSVSPCVIRSFRILSNVCSLRSNRWSSCVRTSTRAKRRGCPRSRPTTVPTTGGPRGTSVRRRRCGTRVICRRVSRVRTWSWPASSRTCPRSRRRSAMGRSRRGTRP